MRCERELVFYKWHFNNLSHLRKISAEGDVCTQYPSQTLNCSSKSLLLIINIPQLFLAILLTYGEEVKKYIFCFKTMELASKLLNCSHIYTLGYCYCFLLRSAGVRFGREFIFLKKKKKEKHPGIYDTFFVWDPFLSLEWKSCWIVKIWYKTQTFQLTKWKVLADLMLRSSLFCLGVAALITKSLLSAAVAYQIRSSTCHWVQCLLD